MKKIIVILVGILAIVSVSKAEDRPVKYDQIPAAAKAFVQTNFPSVKVLHATVDKDHGNLEYGVMLKNGVSIQFDAQGTLEKIEAKKGSIPEAVIPVMIRDYVTANYPDVTITEYEVDKKGYEVKLSNRLELKFDNDFKLVKLDD